MSKSLIFVFLASLTVTSCVLFDARNVNPEIDQNPKSIDYREKYSYIKSREKSGQDTKVVFSPFSDTIASEKTSNSKIAPVRRNLEVVIFCDGNDKTRPVSTLIRGKDVAWFLRKKTSSPREIAMTDQDGMIYIPVVADPSDEIIITYGKFVSKAIKVENQNPIEVHLHCDKK